MGDLGRMPNLKKYKETKLIRPDLNVFLAVGAIDLFTGKKKENNLEHGFSGVLFMASCNEKLKQNH